MNDASDNNVPRSLLFGARGLQSADEPLCERIGDRGLKCNSVATHVTPPDHLHKVCFYMCSVHKTEFNNMFSRVNSTGLMKVCTRIANLIYDDLVTPKTDRRN